MRYDDTLSLATQRYVALRASLAKCSVGVFVVAIAFLYLTSCATDYPRAAETSSLRYATNLSIIPHDTWTEVRLRNPWDTTAILHTYILVPAEESLPQPLPKGTLVRTPLRRAGVATAVACGLLDELGCANAIAGVCERQYIHTPAVQQGLRDGCVADFGNGMNPDIERIMKVAPDALLLTPFEHNGGYGRVERLGIPIIECAEYMETSALGRAEWMKFYGLLFGAEDIADSIFADVVSRYETWSCQAASDSISPSPTVLTELMYGGQWFVPCAQSTMGRMLADACANNPFADLQGSGSEGLAFEQVLMQAHDADVWLIKYNHQNPISYESLAADYRPYTQFLSWRRRHIWACDLDATHFFEQTPFHPERLLRDLVIILHPQLFPGEQTTYYHPLSQSNANTTPNQ